MSEAPYEVLIRYNNDGSVAGGHIKNLITTDSGKVYEGEQINFVDTDDPAYAKVAGDFSAKTVAELEALKAEKAQLEKDLAAKTTEYDSTNAQYEALVIEKAKLVEDNSRTVAESTERHSKEILDLVDRNKLTLDQINESNSKALQDAAEAKTALTALQSRFGKLLNELPFDPRICDATAFYNRITKDEFASLSVSDDETLRAIAKTILAYKTNDWPIVFESPELQGMFAYLQGTGFLSEDRIKQLTLDASQSEAYVPEH